MLKKHAEKLRFAVVGGANTVIDFAILFSLVSVGLPVIASNFISTSVALVFSFFANKKFTFQDAGKNSQSKFAYFLVITLVGLWIIQPIIITATAYMISDIGIPDPIVLFIGKILATIVTLIWNYLLYSKFVFKK